MYCKSNISSYFYCCLGKSQMKKLQSSLACLLGTEEHLNKLYLAKVTSYPENILGLYDSLLHQLQEVLKQTLSAAMKRRSVLYETCIPSPIFPAIIYSIKRLIYLRLRGGEVWVNSWIHKIMSCLMLNYYFLFISAVMLFIWFPYTKQCTNKH